MGVVVEFRGLFRPIHPLLPNAVATSLSQIPAAPLQYQSVVPHRLFHHVRKKNEEYVPERRKFPLMGLQLFEQDAPLRIGNAR